MMRWFKPKGQPGEKEKDNKKATKIVMKEGPFIFEKKGADAQITLGNVVSLISSEDPFSQTLLNVILSDSEGREAIIDHLFKIKNSDTLSAIDTLFKKPEFQNLIVKYYAEHYYLIGDKDFEKNNEEFVLRLEHIGKKKDSENLNQAIVRAMLNDLLSDSPPVEKIKQLIINKDEDLITNKDEDPKIDLIYLFETAQPFEVEPDEPVNNPNQEKSTAEEPAESEEESVLTESGWDYEPEAINPSNSPAGWKYKVTEENLFKARGILHDIKWSLEEEKEKTQRSRVHK